MATPAPALALPFFSSISFTGTAIPKLKPLLFQFHAPLPLPLPLFSFSTANRFTFRLPNSRKLRRNPTPPAAAMIFPQYPVFSDTCATVVSGLIALSVLRLWEETAKRGLFDQKLNRKLVHISIGLVFMLCWPLFSSGYRGAVLAAVTPGVNIIRMLLIGSGIWKDEATVKSMSRYGDYSKWNCISF